MKTKKLKFRFTVNSLNFLDKIVRMTNSSRSTVIRNAIRIYEFILRKKSEGYKIKLIKGKEEIII